MRTSLRKIILALALVCIGLTGVAHAAESSTTQERVVAPVMVTATRAERDLMEVPMSVAVVGEKDLQRDPNLDVASQLAEIPGIQVHGQTSAGTRRVMIRGMSGTRTLILVDGVRQPELRGIDGSIFNVDPSNIERIEVIKGPASVLYGSDAIGGVVNIITKKSTRADKPISVKVGMTYDSSVGSVEPRATLSGNYKGFNYLLSGSGISAGNRQTPKGEVWNSNFEQQEFAGQLGYTWDKNSIHFSVNHRNGTSNGIPTMTPPGGLLIPTDPIKTPTVLNVTESENSRTGYNLTTQFDDLSEYFKRLKVHTYYQRLYNASMPHATINHATYANGQRISKTDKYQDSYGGSVQTDWTMGDHYAIAGIEYDKAVLDSKLYNYNVAGIKSAATDKRDGFQQTIALFLQDEWEVLNKLKLTLGLRQTWVETKLTGYTSNPAMEDGVKDDSLVGSASLVYTGIDKYSFRAMYSQGYRNPNLLMLFMGSGTMMLPNPDLKPEKSSNYELGVRYSDGAFNADAALFLSDLKDGMSMQNVPGTTSYQYINYNKVRSMGAELALDYTFEKLGLTPYGSVTWLRYETRDNGWKNRHTGQPSFWGKAGLKWETQLNEKNRIFTDANVVMTTGAYSNSRNAATGVVTKSNDRPGWATANLSVGFEGAFLNSDSVKYNSSLHLRNLFDKYYTPIVASPMPEPGFNVVWTFGLEY